VRGLKERTSGLTKIYNVTIFPTNIWQDVERVTLVRSEALRY
jgi:hypothetical protein